MRYAAIAACLLLFLAYGCVFNEPAEVTSTIPVNESLLGLWENLPEKAGDAPTEKIMLLKLTNTEYMVWYETSPSKGMYFRAWPFRIAKTDLLQLQLIGTSDGPVKKTEAPYHIAKLELSQNSVAIRMVNTSIVKPAFTGAQQRAAIEKNLSDKNLFAEPGIFRRVATGQP